MVEAGCRVLEEVDSRSAPFESEGCGTRRAPRPTLTNRGWGTRPCERSKHLLLCYHLIGTEFEHKLTYEPYRTARLKADSSEASSRKRRPQSARRPGFLKR